MESESYSLAEYYSQYAQGEDYLKKWYESLNPYPDLELRPTAQSQGTGPFIHGGGHLTADVWKNPQPVYQPVAYNPYQQAPIQQPGNAFNEPAFEARYDAPDPDNPENIYEPPSKYVPWTQIDTSPVSPAEIGPNRSIYDEEPSFWDIFFEKPSIDTSPVSEDQIGPNRSMYDEEPSFWDFLY